MSKLDVLLTGASGYIGGAVLSRLLSMHGDKLIISALVRSPDHAAKLRKLGVTPIVFQGLHDLETLKVTASRNQVVISCASALDLNSCIALVEGLGVQKSQSGQEVFYIHTSGASNFGDRIITGAPILGARSDKDEIFDWEAKTEDEWILRKVDVAITNKGLQLGVKTCIVNPPLIYGKGDGIGNQHSIQVPTLIKLSLAAKEAVLLDKGRGVWRLAHISDVANMYVLLHKRIISSAPLEVGKYGYYFVESEEVTWLEISEAIAKAGHAQGFFESSGIREITSSEMEQMIGLPYLNASMIEVIWGSNSQIRGDRSREIGWIPFRSTRFDFFETLAEEVSDIAGFLDHTSQG